MTTTTGTRMVPIIAIVSEAVAERVAEIAATTTLPAQLGAVAARNGWTVEALVAGSTLDQVFRDAYGNEQSA